MKTDSLLFDHGQLSQWNGERRYIGKLGREFDVEGQRAAKLCALNVIAQLHAALDGDLDRVVRCVRIGGFVNSMPDFGGQSQVINGASDTCRRLSSENSDGILNGRRGGGACRMTSQWKSKDFSKSADLRGAPNLQWLAACSLTSSRAGRE